MRYLFICGNQIEPVKVITTDTEIISNPTEEQIDNSGGGKPKSRKPLQQTLKIIILFIRTEKRL